LQIRDHHDLNQTSRTKAQIVLSSFGEGRDKYQVTCRWAEGPTQIWTSHYLYQMQYHSEQGSSARVTYSGHTTPVESGLVQVADLKFAAPKLIRSLET